MEYIEYVDTRTDASIFMRAFALLILEELFNHKSLDYHTDYLNIYQHCYTHFPCGQPGIINTMVDSICGNNE